MTAHPPPNDELEEAKTELRAAARDRREHAHAIGGAAAARAVRDRFLAKVPLAHDATVAGYWPFGNELDPMPLLHALHARGYRLALPVVVRRRAPLVFRQWKPGDAMATHHFGMSEPLATSPQVDPDLLLVPLLAFDGEGNRIGYGGGFYDRTIVAQRQFKALRAVGVAFSVQQVERIPTTANDQKLDWIVTEKEALPMHHEARTGWFSWWPW
ncbi:MAG: 5-formyltetrahydrofolate cyclo-ligase [Proteobacteria bacterium]|nr:5-formyltetrahydrofolate cyclo-ligase [Pseudomonadota bacterium]